MSNFDMNMQVEDMAIEIDDYDAIMRELSKTAAELEKINESNKS